MKRCVLSRRRNADVTSSGRSFRIRGPTTGKARLATVDSLKEALPDGQCRQSEEIGGHADRRHFPLLLFLSFRAASLKLKLVVDLLLVSKCHSSNSMSVFLGRSLDYDQGYSSFQSLLNAAQVIGIKRFVQGCSVKFTVYCFCNCDLFHRACFKLHQRSGIRSCAHLPPHSLADLLTYLLTISKL